MPYSFAGRYFDKDKPFFSYGYKDYSFQLDLEFGELYFTKKLVSFSGRYLPIDISLKYVFRHSIAADNLHVDTGFPKGFKTNFHVFLEYDSQYNKYHYEDADGFLHEFELAENSSDLYFDAFGSGLMLKKLANNSGYRIFDDDGNYQEFDASGRLTSINKKTNNNSYARQLIFYQTDLKISLIVDNYNRSVSFSYNPNSIIINYINNTIATLSFNSGLLTKISKNIGGNHIVEEGFFYSLNKLADIDLDSGESFSFAYDDYKIVNFVTNVKQDAFSFTYGSNPNHPTAEVTNARGVITHYEFGENQLISRTSENNNPLSYSKINSDITSCLIKTTNDSDEIIDFIFGINNETFIDVDSYCFGSSQTATNNNLQAKKMYLLVAEIEGNLGSEHFDLSLLDYDNNLLAKLIFSGTTKILAAPVGIRASTPKSFSVSYSNFTFGLITIIKVRLLPLIGDFEILCSDVNTYGPIFFYGDTPYYLFPSGIVDTINNTPVGNMEKSFTITDLLVNEKLFYKRNGNYRFWADDKKILFDNVSSAFVLLKSNYYIGYDSSYGKIALYDTPNVRISDLSIYRLKGRDDNSLSVTKISHDSVSFHTGYTFYYYEEMTTKYVAGNLSSITYYDYDEHYRLREANRNDGYKEEYNYQTTEHLDYKIVSHANINEQIKYEYGYGSYDELLSEKKLIGSSFVQINYGYDFFGNVISVSYPNQLVKSLAYDNISGERNLNHSFTANNVTIIQNNNYIDEENDSFSTTNNTYSFTYDDGRLSEVSYNNQQILSISYEEGIYGNTSLNIGETINYSNGDSDYTEYDAFDRVYVTNNTEYSYDDYLNLTRIIDGAVGQYNAYSFYYYNYYNQCTNIEVDYNNLSVSFAYDIYRRLVNKELSFYENTLYEIDYSYYNLPDLENTVKQSSITIDSQSINVIDNVDSFSRLTSQTISFGSNAFTKTLAYCVDSLDSGYTNNMVSRISYTYITNGNTVSNNETDVYSYDNMGNIFAFQKYSGNNLIFQIDYIYDEFSRLIRENNLSYGRTFTYYYDNEGNITAKNEYLYTTSQVLPNTPVSSHFYSYNPTYPNQLSSFDNQICAYDSVGNPTTYRDKTMRWIRGTLLNRVIDGSTTIILDYDGFKHRIKKQTGSETTYYNYIDNQLIIEQKSSGVITYLYSHQGVIGFVLSDFNSPFDGTYFYEKNIQQDVIVIRDINNSIKAKYVYDAWGNHKVLNPNGTENTSLDFIGNINPIRYRSYYYDTDLKMYWLTTRYYDPEVGRFISPDHYSYLDYKTLHGLNLYAYSKNNPVMYYDPNGHFAFGCFIDFLNTIKNTFFAIAAIAGVSEYANSVKTNKIDYNEKSGDIKIKESAKVWNPISVFGFLLLMTNSQEYKEKVKNPKRNVFDYWLEWEIHNLAAGFFTATSTSSIVLSVFFPPFKSLIAFNLYQLSRAIDVDMENSPNWFIEMFGWK